MKRLLYVAVSAIGVGAVVLAQTLMKRKDQQPKKNSRRGKASEDGAGSERNSSRLSNMTVKKDGSLDMRHKENKEAVTSGTAHHTVHLKKNGEPDRRYKENRDR